MRTKTIEELYEELLKNGEIVGDCEIWYRLVIYHLVKNESHDEKDIMLQGKDKITIKKELIQKTNIHHV